MLVKVKTKPDNLIMEYYGSQKSFSRRILIKIRNRVAAKFRRKKIRFNSLYEFISVDEISVNTKPNQIVDLIGFVPDFIFTGITNGFMNSTDLVNLQKYTNAKLYNITVDMSHFTGGCHYAWDCKGYINGCDSNCPAIISSEGKDLARRNFETKLKNSIEGNFKIIAGSGWTLKQAMESKIYKNQSEIYNVNSLIDTKLFNGKNRAFAKSIFNLHSDKFYILMGCQHSNAKRKGFEYLLEALQILAKKLTREQKDRIEVIIVSRNNANKFDEIPFQKQYLEFITDYRLLSLLYQATNVFINSSIEDSGPMMVSEALACGTPVVGFDMGVVTNMVISGYNGYKAKNKNSEDLARGIETIINLSEIDYVKYSNNAIRRVEDFSSLQYANKVFAEILK